MYFVTVLCYTVWLNGLCLLPKFSFPTPIQGYSCYSIRD